MKTSTIAGLSATLMLIRGGAAAEELQTYTVTLKAHKFAPIELHVPSAKPFYLVVVNQDDTADEFEMSAPPLEKVVQPGAEGRVRVRPLAPGKFSFFDDFHPEAKGALVAD
jgi:hypothetical protein